MINTIYRSALAGTLATLVANVAVAQFGAGPAELSLTKVADDIYVIQNELVPGNSTAVIGEEGVLLIDVKFAIDDENLMRLLRTVTDAPVLYVVDTHYHDDHSGANANHQARGAKVFSAENARSKMIEAGRTEGLPEVTLTDHTRIYIGGKPADIYYFGRSHTDGDVMVHLPEQRVAVMGDMFTHGAGLAQLVDYPGGGSMRAWTGTVEKALMLEFDTVIPGHGLVTNRAGLEQFRDDSERLQDMVRSMLNQNRSREDIANMLRNEFRFEDFHLDMSLDGMLLELR
jgi:cyclase